jgi:serine/threonine protein kinase
MATKASLKNNRLSKELIGNE